MMSSVGERAASAARRALRRSRCLRGALWPPTDAALRRRRDGSIVMAAAWLALTGREPTAAEQARLLARSRRGLSFEGLVEEVLETPEAMELAVTRGSRAVRRIMDADIEAAGPEAGRSEPRVLLLHIMKTGGISLSHLLEQLARPARSAVSVFLDDLLTMPAPRLKSLRTISGHIPFEALELLPVPFQTVTVLRDPVARTLSHYRELQRSHAVPGGLSLDEFLSDERYAVPSGNYQARALAHSVDLAQAWVTYSPKARYLQAGGQEDQLYPLQALFDSTPIQVSDEQLLETATKNLSAIDVVGTTESLDGVARRLCHLFGAPYTEVPHLNASEPTPDELPTRLRRLIEQRTELDRELYGLARRLSRD